MYPGATVGVLGSGQLGRMFAIAARRMGYRVHTYSPDTDTPTGQVADLEVTADYLDLDRVRKFAAGVDVITFEFENVPAETAETAVRLTPVRPAGHVLHTTQNRIREKTFLSNAGLPVTPFAPVHSLAELHEALRTVGCPGVLKTAGFGYDGKGQIAIRTADAAEASWDALGRVPAVLERFIDFECELSVVAARGLDGSFEHFGAVTNQHRNHILDVTTAPAQLPDRVQADAVDITRAVLEKLDVCGVLCVEFFLGRNGALMINELAPRPHNSGHWTFDACVTSQFEQQLRAVCGLPLGSSEQLRPAAMANLLGDLWAHWDPDWSAALALPEIKLHLYGKASARPGRKMGHLTALGENATDRVIAARQALRKDL